MVFSLDKADPEQEQRVRDLSGAFLKFARVALANDPRFAAGMSASELLSAVTLFMVTVASELGPLEVIQKLVAGMWPADAAASALD